MAGKRKAEGIALLSLYNDEEDEEEEEEDDEVDVDEKGHYQQEHEEKGHGEGEEEPPTETIAEIVAVQGSFTKLEAVQLHEDALFPLSVVSAKEDSLSSTSAVDRSGSAHGIIVDYDHDEAALSPEAEEGEIMSTGRAVFGLDMQASNGFFQGVRSPGTLGLLMPENVQSDDQSPQLKVDVIQDQAAATAPVEFSDTEMIGTEGVDTDASKVDPLADFLPPAPAAKCSEELQHKFSKYLALKNAGRSFNEELRKSKGYRNPDFLQHAVKHQEIDQIGSCFSKKIFDPHGYDPSDFYDALALELRREQERKELAKKQSQRVDFVHGGVQAAPIVALTDKSKHALPVPTGQKGSTTIHASNSGSQGVTATSEAAPQADGVRSNKKSKWDKVDTDTRAPPLPPVAKSAIAAASAHAALLTATSGGGYASFAHQKRREAEERSRGSEKKSDKK